MAVCVCAKLLQSCPTLCDPMGQPDSSVHGSQEYIYPKPLYFLKSPLFALLSNVGIELYRRKKINTAFGHTIYFSSIFIHLNLDILYVKLRNKPKMRCLGCLSNASEQSHPNASK